MGRRTVLKGLQQGVNNRTRVLDQSKDQDPETGKDVQGRYRVNPNSGEFERADLSFAEHWANRPDAIKFSPILSFLYATGQNLSEWMSKNAFKGYNEAGLRTDKSLIGLVGIQSGVLHIAYAFDYTFMSIGQHSYGSHEVSVGINIPDPRKIKFFPKKNKKKEIEDNEI